MIGYGTLGTDDLPRAQSFYDALLAEMGVKRMMEFGDRGSAWAAAMDKPMLCIMKPYNGRPATVGNGVLNRTGRYAVPILRALARPAG